MHTPVLKIQDRIYKRTLFHLIPERVHPNHITISRFILTPLVVFLILQELYTWGIALFLLVAFTDTVDGALARVRNQITPWGQVYDPIADKLLIGSLVGILVIRHLDPFLALVIIGIEVLFVALGWYKLSTGVEVQANNWGKAKMVLQVIGVLLLLLALSTGFQGFFDISSQTFYLAIVFAIISLFTSGL